MPLDDDSRARETIRAFLEDLDQSPPTKQEPVDQTVAGDAIRAVLKELDRSQSWLGAEVAAREGRTDPYSQAVVFEWLDGQFIPPARMFLIEEVLGVRRGSISRLCGYVPADVRPQSTVLAALEADQEISADQRAMLKAAYEAARSQSRSRARRRPR